MSLLENPTRATGEALRRATERARGAGKNSPGTADFVAAILSLDRGIGRRSLTLAGVLREDVLRALENAPPETDLRAAGALSAARRLAAGSMVTTGHLLIGSLSDPTSAAAQALVAAGARVETLRVEVDDLHAAGYDDDALSAPPPPTWMQPSAEDRGTGVAWRVVLADTPRVTAIADSFIAYPSGFEYRLTLSAAPRESIPAQPWKETADGGIDVRLEAVPGVQYTRLEPSAIRGEPASGMVVASGPARHSGSRRRSDFIMWCWPLPPAQMLDVVCHWAAFDISDARVRVDGAELRAAAAMSAPLWRRHSE